MTHGPAALSLTRATGTALALAAAWPSLGHGFVGAGLDPSWQDGLRAAVEQGDVFGRDVIFTHGPLGFLVTRVPPAGLGWTLPAIDLALLALCGWLAWRLGGRRGGLALQGLLAAALVSCCPYLGGMDLPMAVSWLGLACVAAGASPDTDAGRDGRSRRATSAPWLALAGVGLASLTFLMKANTGLIVPGVTAAWLAWRAWASRRPGLMMAALALPVLVVGAGAAVVPVSLPDFARWSARVASGYQDSQAVAFADAGVVRAWWASVAAIGTLFLAGLWASTRGMVAADRLAVLVACGLAAVAIKQGFVRADVGHAAMALRALPGAALVMAAGASPALRTPAMAAGIVVVALTWALQVPHPLGQPRAHAAASRAYARALWRGDLTEADTRHVPRLPAGWVAALAGRTVDVLSPDLVLVTREPGIRWRPRPTFQGYIASHPSLDEWNATHFLSARAPDVLLVAAFATCVDDRCWLDEPRTREAIWRAYQPVGRANDLLVLARRAQPLSLAETSTVSVAWSLGAEIPLPAPPPGGRLRLHLPVARTALASLQRIALSPPGLEVRLSGALGARAVRVWPSLLAQGILVSPVAESPEGLIDEAAGALDRLARPRSATVSASDGWGYVVTGPARLTTVVPGADSRQVADPLVPALDPATPVRVDAWREAASCEAGYVDHWPSPNQPLIAGWAVVPGASRPADRVVFTRAGGGQASPLAAALTVRWRPDVAAATSSGAATLSGFRQPAWWSSDAPLAPGEVDAWAWDSASGDAWRLCWAMPR